MRDKKTTGDGCHRLCLLFNTKQTSNLSKAHVMHNSSSPATLAIGVEVHQ